MKKILNYLLISNIFTVGFELFNTPFEFYIGYIFMILFLGMYFYSYGKIRINRVFIFILMLVSLLSLLNLLLGNTSLPLFLKQFFGFLLNGVVYYLLIRFNNYNIDKLFCVYLRLAFVIAIIGILQEISFLIHFTPGYDYSYFIPKFSNGTTMLGMLRISSLLPESSHFAAAMAPAMFISVLNIIKNENNFISRKASFLIIISVLLSFTLVAYSGIFLAFILIMSNHQKVKLMAVCTIILLAFTIISYRYLPGIRMRVNDTVDVISGKKPLNDVNLSTFALYSNGFIAYKSFMNNPLFGSGLGSHSVSYDRYITRIVDSPRHGLGLNKGDACSLFLRLISETGLLGIFLFLYFIVKFYVSRKKDAHFWMISNSIICIFILHLMKQGNYFYCGFIFFVWAYYFTNKNCRSVNNTLDRNKLN